MTPKIVSVWRLRLALPWEMVSSIFSFFCIFCRFASSSVKPQSSRRFLLPRAPSSNFPHSFSFLSTNNVHSMIPILLWFTLSSIGKKIKQPESSNVYNGNPQKKKKLNCSFSFFFGCGCVNSNRRRGGGNISNDKLMHTLSVSLERENLLATTRRKKERTRKEKIAAENQPP